MGHAAVGAAGSLPWRRGHPIQDILLRDDSRALRGIVDVTGDVAASDGFAGLGYLFVATGVIGVNVSVDDVANQGTIGISKFADRGQNVITHLRQTRVHQQYAIRSHRDRDVSTGAEQHVDISLNRNT